MGLFRGLSATLARDVPFSAIYWTCYESMKQQRWWKSLDTKDANDANDDVSDEFWTTFLSGAVAGAIAATLTHPFDVVKTLKQIEVNDSMMMTSRSTRSILTDVVRAEGMAGLMTGWVPRMAKIAPACAIMISSYETGKRYFGVHEDH